MSPRMNDGRSRTTHISQILETIEQRDPLVRAYCEVSDKQARAQVEKLDALPPEKHGPLHGIGAGIKEVFDVAGALCAWGTEIHAGRRPESDAVIVQVLRDAGCVILGTTASTEYAMAKVAPTTNPHDKMRTPGASSSGSAAAVAAGMADIAIGSQTIGSGIRPAAYCGVFAFKPTQGIFSLEGAMPLSDILDHPVIFAGDMSLIKKAFDVLCCSDAALTQNLKTSHKLPEQSSPLKIALVTPWFNDAYSADVWNMVSSFARQIPQVECNIETLPEQIGAQEEACLQTILAADMWRHHGDDYRLHADKMSDGLKTWLERGRDIKAQDYRAALDERLELLAEAWNALDGYDFVMTLATTDTAPLLTEGTGSRAPQRLWNLLGCPALTGPVGTIDGLPVGIQIISRPGSDAELLNFAAKIFGDTISIVNSPER